MLHAVETTRILIVERVSILFFQLVQHSKDTPVPVTVVRGSGRRAVDLKLTPRVWAGRGLLGCNIVPEKQAELDR